MKAIAFKNESFENFQRVKTMVNIYLKSALGRSFLGNHMHFEAKDHYQHI